MGRQLLGFVEAGCWTYGSTLLQQPLHAEGTGLRMRVFHRLVCRVHGS